MKDNISIDMEYVRNNPNKLWNKYHLSYNKQLTVKDVETLILPNSIEEWRRDIMSRYIDIQEIRNNPHKPWDKRSLSLNKGLTIKDVETLVLSNSINDWDWNYISECINIQEVINNPNKSWSKDRLIYNNDITEKILQFFDTGLLKHLQKNIPKFKYHTDIVIKCEC